MIEDAQEILDYLPRVSYSPQEQEYPAFLWSSFESNYMNGKYQFAFIAYHMLFMLFVYFSVWKIRLCQSDDFAKALIGFNHEVEKDFIDATSPFAFSRVEERRFLRFFKLLGCDNAKIGELAKHVDDRNDIAHSNGNIFYRTPEELDMKIKEIVRCAEQLQPCFSELTAKAFISFLEHSFDPNDREYNDDRDQIAEILLRKNYLSTKDIDICLQYDITNLSTRSDFSAIQTLFNSFTALYKPA